MGFYYPMTFNAYHPHYAHFPFVDDAHAQIHELVDNYKPDILWSDSYWKPHEKSMAIQWRSEEAIAYFYNSREDSDELVTNDRWGKLPGDLLLGDFGTPEYRPLPELTSFKWELNRGVGASFGYNAAEGDAQYMSVDELIHLLVDVVSKNGNLLLNIGPKADGTIAELQEQRLVGLGEWLGRCGEAIFATRPWVVAKGETREGVPLRFTYKQATQTVYAMLMEQPGRSVTLTNMRFQPNTTVSMLGSDEAVKWSQDDDGVHLTMPARLPGGHVYPLAITPEPFALLQWRPTLRDTYPSETWRRMGFLELGGDLAGR
jgi:alpha-L-fucosidase